MNPLDQLLHDAMTEHTESVPHLRPGSARKALAASRRRQRLTMAAAGTATVAATAGVGTFAIHLQPATSATGSYGGAGTGHHGSAHDPTTSKHTPAAVAPKAGVPAKAEKGAPKAETGPPVPAASAPANAADYSGKSEPESAAPADLRAVTLTGPVAGLTLAPQPEPIPSSETFYQLSESGKWSKWYWFAPTGRDAAAGSSGNVTITKGTSRPLWNQVQSPSPAVAPTTVNQRPATVWLSGGDREIYYTAGDFTVEVFVSDKNITLDQMKALGDAVQGLPQ